MHGVAWRCVATLLSRSQIPEAYPDSEKVALELKGPEAGRAVGYTLRADWLGTAMQSGFIEYLRQERTVDKAGRLR